MRIISLELTGYKYLALSNINYIKITPESKLQLILGTNGSGKSSLLLELTPLPADKTAFTKEGSKIIEIFHRGSHYVLKSIFATNDYHFIKDDIELNPGRTVTTYKELVKQHFNITADVHELMVGSHHFHAMSTNERRNWFTKISHVDYTYALQYYQKLKEQLRDIQGAIKLNQSRLVQETDKLLTPTLEAQYRQEILDLNKLISTLLDLKRPTSGSRQYLQTEVTNTDLKIKDISKQLKSYRSKFLNFEGYSSTFDIDNRIIELQSSHNTYTNKVADICKLIDEKRKALSILEQANIENTSNIDGTIEYLDRQLSELYGTLVLPCTFDDARVAMSALMTVYEPLTEIFLNVDEVLNTVIDGEIDATISRDRYMILVDEYKATLTTQSEIDQQLTTLINKRKELEHFKEHNQLECPRCKHTWYKGYDEVIYNKVLASITSTSDKLSEVKTRLHTLEQHINRIKQFLTLQRQYIDVTNNWLVLKPLWDYIIKQEKFFTEPRALLQLLNTTKLDLQIHIKISELQARKASQLELQSMMTKNQVMNIESISNEIDHYTNKLHMLNTHIDTLQLQIQRHRLYKDSANHISRLENELQNLMAVRDTAIDNVMLVYKQEALNETINVIKIELSQREQVISKMDIQKALVESLEKQINELSDKAIVLKVAVKELSPTEGLIAKGMTGFINHFLAQVNNFLRKIWSYPLELQPIHLPEDDSVDLDYKFPVLVNERQLVPDVSKCSSAQKEIINIAFKVVSMQYLDLEEFPLFLDEPGSASDHVHRESIFRAIHQLITVSNISNCFLVSHYEQGYGCMVNTDITVLCRNNIILPKDAIVNRNTIIK